MARYLRPLALTLFVALITLTISRDAAAQYAQSCPQRDPYCAGDPRWVTATQSAPIAQVPQRRFGTAYPVPATPTFQWDASVAVPLITQAKATSGGGVLMKMVSQSAATGSAASGGNIRVLGGLGDGAGATGRAILGSGDLAALVSVGHTAGDLIALGANPATTGYVRLDNTAGINWRNGTNSADVTGMSVDSSNNLLLGDGANTNNVKINGTGTVQWALANQAPILNEAQQANGSNPNPFTITPQAPGAGAGSTPTGTPGSLVVALATPVSTGTEAGIQVTRGGTLKATLQTAPSGTGLGAVGALILGGTLTPSNTNYAVIGDGATTVVNGASELALSTGGAFSGGTVMADIATTGIQLAGRTNAFGGGTGVIGITNAGGLFTTVPTGGGVVAHDSLGLHYDGPSTSFTDYMVAPSQQGTANSQVEKSRVYSGVCRTTTNGAITCLTIPCATSASVCSVFVTCSGRDVTSGTVGDSFTYENAVGFKNVAGTVTAATVQGTALNAHDTSMAAVAVSYAISSTNILVQVTGLTSVTIDYTCEARAINN